MSQTNRSNRHKASFALLASALILVAFLLNSRQAIAEPAATAGEWNALQHISTESDYGAFAASVEVAPDGTIMVMYDHERPIQVNGMDAYTPYYSRSDDQGRTWTEGPAYRGSDSAVHVDFAFDSQSKAHAVWRTEDGLWYAHEDSWTTPGTEIVASDPERWIGKPAIAIDPADDTIFVVWLHAAANDSWDVYYRYSRDNGAHWEPDLSQTLLTTVDGNTSDAPDVAFDANGDVHVVWEEKIFDPAILKYRWEVLYQKGTRTGANIYTWEPEWTILSDTNPENPNQDLSTSSRQPALAVDGNKLHVVFENREEVSEGGYNRQITPSYVTQGANGNWQAPQNVGGSTPYFVNTALPYYLGTTVAACSGNVHVFFHGAKGANSIEQVWATERDGSGWTQPVAVTSDEARYTHPALACDGGTLYLTVEQIGADGETRDVYYMDNASDGIFLPILLR